MYLEAQFRILTLGVTNLINYFKTTKYSYNRLFTGATFVFDRGKNHSILLKMLFHNFSGLLVIWFCQKLIYYIRVTDCKLSALHLLLPWFGTIFYVYCLNWLGELINIYHLRKKPRIMNHSSIEQCKILCIFIRFLRANNIRGVLTKIHRLVKQEITVLSNSSQLLWIITNICNTYNISNAPTLLDGGFKSGGNHSKPTSNHE